MTTIVRTISLSAAATSAMTSTVGEPSILNIGQNMLASGNWYASRSNNDGANWSAVNPFSFFPKANDGFCCDQTLLAAPLKNMSFWLLQYIEDENGNTLRLAVNNGYQMVDTDWFWWDLVPQNVNPAWAGEWFDYNHAALSDNFLYVVTNSFTIDEKRFKRCVVFRFELDRLRPGAPVSLEFFESNDFSLRATQGATDKMYFATHISDRKIRLYEWAESNATATSTDISITRWRGGSGGYSAPGPDGRNWLSRCDPRITAGWIADDVMGFGWSVDGGGTRPFPHVRIVRIDANTKAVLSEPDIWSQNTAYAYADATPNEDGDVGVAFFRGGGGLHPGPVVGSFDSALGTGALQSVKNGTNGPSDGKWGDYQTCRQNSNNRRHWLAISYSLQGGPDRNNIEPVIVEFSP